MGQGLQGTPKARIHTIFRNRLVHLRDSCLTQAESFQQTGQREWQIPQSMQAADLFDIANLHTGDFDRTAINENYVDAIKDAQTAGTTGDIISLKWQMDYNAMEERAFRARHTGPIRGMCHAMLRRKFMHDGSTFDNIEAQAADAIAAGARK